ncbi:Methionyl-tRNA formyltransferase [Rhizina undulata]
MSFLPTAKRLTSRLNRLFQCRQYSAPRHPPLRILYCGSDHFSATSLKALHNEYISNPSLIASIDVVCPEDKREGRGMNTLREVPIKDVARSLSLPIHDPPTFTSWNLPNPDGEEINLIIAVSFGRLIPARLLKSTLYGGLNVHPSLLPMYRGAAPIYHTLLNSTPVTGVTVQTLHPKKFDHGAILLQTDPPFQIPPKTSYSVLHDALALHGASMLLETLRRGLFVPPLNPITPKFPASEAPKISPNKARIDFAAHSARELEQRCGALGTLWGRLAGKNLKMEKRLRAIFTDVAAFEHPELRDEVEAGEFEYLKLVGEDGGKDEVLAVKVGSGWVRVGGIKVEGKGIVDGGEWARTMKGKPHGLGNKRFV